MRRLGVALGLRTDAFCVLRYYDGVKSSYYDGVKSSDVAHPVYHMSIATRTALKGFPLIMPAPIGYFYEPRHAGTGETEQNGY